MSIHLVGGGLSGSADAGIYRPFIDEASHRAAAIGRAVPRIGVLLAINTDDDDVDYPHLYTSVLERVAACVPVVSTVPEESDAVFPSAVLSDIDGLVIGGGLTPAYFRAVEPLIDEIRLLVADGLPYLGYSAGAMIAAEHAILGGWRIGDVAVAPEETSEDLDDVTVVDGLGLVDLAVDVHAAQWGTLGRLIAATEAGLVDGGVAIDECTALIVGEGIRVVGTGSVWRVSEGSDGVVVSTLGS